MDITLEIATPKPISVSVLQAQPKTIKVSSGGSITVEKIERPITVVNPTYIEKIIALPGTQGPQGVQGLPGVKGDKGESTDLALLADVIVTNPTTNQFLKYNGTKWTNVNTETLDGGNF